MIAGAWADASPDRLDDTSTPMPAPAPIARPPSTMYSRRRDAGWCSAGMMYAELRTGTGGGGNPRAVDIAVRVAAASRNHRA